MFCSKLLLTGGFCASTWKTSSVKIVISFLLPSIGFFGILGNGLSAFIYSRKEMISSLNMYLCALACSDIIIILTAFFLFFMESMRRRSEAMTYYFAVLSPVMFPLGELIMLIFKSHAQINIGGSQQYVPERSIEIFDWECYSSPRKAVIALLLIGLLIE
ncbi:hypothetical protein NECAME_09340 [Necator americanus]|uniref:G-protein coupled receptors family 1 profile domain-containing protein n=1 Tax=Necator americanus TaxID=51031 RepID=W2TF00_NECAM|nr:hypothetical protein NECAME_09340 [Necator americanus]ETN80174.1 hypothetical protein NECAME_09340 [Necator americanus]